MMVTQVSGTASPRALQSRLFYATKAGLQWEELTPEAQQTPTLAFDAVWGQCTKYVSKKVEKVLLVDFLRVAGVNSNFPKNRIKTWTSRKSRLGVRKADFNKVRVASGSGRSSRWAAAKPTLQKVWKQLRHRRAARRV